MKICTITCHDVYNFGASLQAYALQHYLESLGHEVEIIDYRPAYLYKKYNWKILTNSYEKYSKLFITKWIFRYAKWSYLKLSSGRKKSFDDFTLKYLHLTPVTYHNFNELKKNPPKADIIIAGSDQIWNPLFPTGQDASYYIDFALPKTKRISYAASFSVNQIPKEQKKFIQNLLLKMDAISVREYQGLDILKDLGITNGTKVLDPIFLINVKEWMQFMHRYSYKNYILIYDFEGNSILKETALHFKKKYGLKIFSINDAIPRWYADKNFINVGPQDFIGLIYGCSLFLSNSFHGTAFSAYFNKPFYVFDLIGFKSNSRMNSLLRTLFLENRFVNQTTNIEKLHLECDFTQANEIIEKEILSSKTFLTETLKRSLNEIA